MSAVKRVAIVSAAFLGGIAVPAAAQTAPQAPAVWARCGMCHAVVAGKPSPLGPNLAGVVGRKAASQPNFAYSPAMKASGIVWTPAKIDAFIAKPQAVVAGNKMMFVGLPDAKARAEIVKYLQGAR